MGKIHFVRGKQEKTRVSIRNKIHRLVDKGYQQAAFSQKANAITFIEEWRKKGYKAEIVFRSSGPTVEGKKSKTQAYYVMADRPKGKLHID